MIDQPKPAVPVLTDAKGRKWRLVITAGVYATLRDEHGIDLASEKSVADVYGDYIKQSEVLIACLDKQAKSNGLSTDDVDELLSDPETQPFPHEALEVALTNFYLMRAQAPMLRAMEKIREAQKTLNNTAIQRMDSQAMTNLLERQQRMVSSRMDHGMRMAQKEMDEAEAKLQKSFDTPSTN